MSLIAEDVSELVKVAQPLGQHEAVSASGERLGDIIGDLRCPRGISGEVLVDGGDPARSGRVGLSGVAELCRVDP